MSQRGYNKSDKPKDIQSYDIKFLTGDIAAVLHHFNRQHAIIIGHDWGAMVAWRFAGGKIPEAGEATQDGRERACGVVSPSTF